MKSSSPETLPERPSGFRTKEGGWGGRLPEPESAGRDLASEA